MVYVLVDARLVLCTLILEVQLKPLPEWNQ
jgi:hypothetical protein